MWLVPCTWSLLVLLFGCEEHTQIFQRSNNAWKHCSDQSDAAFAQDGSLLTEKEQPCQELSAVSWAPSAFQMAFHFTKMVFAPLRQTTIFFFIQHLLVQEASPSCISIHPSHSKDGSLLAGSSLATGQLAFPHPPWTSRELQHQTPMAGSRLVDTKRQLVSDVVGIT